MPVESERINPAWTGDDVADLGALMDEFPNFAAIGRNWPRQSVNQPLPSGS